MRGFTAGWIIAGLAALAAMVHLDAAGLGIYFSVLPSAFIAVFVILSGLYCFGQRRRSVGEARALLIGATILVASVIVLPSVKTSDRKGFFLLSAQIRPGMTKTEVLAKLHGYRRQEYLGGVGFYFQADPGTTDCLLVEFAMNQRVLSADYSAD